MGEAQRPSARRDVLPRPGPPGRAAARAGGDRAWAAAAAVPAARTRPKRRRRSSRSHARPRAERRPATSHPRGRRHAGPARGAADALPPPARLKPASSRDAAATSPSTSWRSRRRCPRPTPCSSIPAASGASTATGAGWLYVFETERLEPRVYKAVAIDRGFRRGRLYFPRPDAGTRPRSALEFPLDELLFQHYLARRRTLEVHALRARASRARAALLRRLGRGQDDDGASLAQPTGAGRRILSDDRVVLRSARARSGPTARRGTARALRPSRRAAAGRDLLPRARAGASAQVLPPAAAAARPLRARLSAALGRAPRSRACWPRVTASCTACPAIRFGFRPDRSAIDAAAAAVARRARVTRARRRDDRSNISASCSRYHEVLLLDRARNTAFERALRACIRPGHRVLDIGTGSGVWAVVAARLGAGKVVAVEREPLLAPVIGRLIADNGVADRVEVITGEFPRSAPRPRVRRRGQRDGGQPRLRRRHRPDHGPRARRTASSPVAHSSPTSSSSGPRRRGARACPQPPSLPVSCVSPPSSSRSCPAAPPGTSSSCWLRRVSSARVTSPPARPLTAPALWRRAGAWSERGDTRRHRGLAAARLAPRVCARHAPLRRVVGDRCSPSSVSARRGTVELALEHAHARPALAGPALETLAGREESEHCPELAYGAVHAAAARARVTARRRSREREAVRRAEPDSEAQARRRRCLR